MDEERAARLEADDQVLAAPVEDGDALALQAARDKRRVERPRQPRIRDLDALEAPALDQRRELPADRFDLRELWHESTLVDHLEQHRMRRRRLVGELVRCADLA